MSRRKTISSISSTGSEPRRPRFLPGSRPRRIAHRGLALDGAENTLRAFQDALDAGADMLETDTRATADGLALAVHDATLARIAGDPRPVGSLSTDEARAVTITGGEPLAVLEDVLGSFPDIPVNIDVKDADAIAPAARAIARTRAVDRICLAGFDGKVAYSAAVAVRTVTGRTPLRSPARGAMVSFALARAAEAPSAVINRILAPYGAIQIPQIYRGLHLTTDRNIAAAHRAGCEVHVWTVDDPRAMRDLLAKGVDGIVTNRVDLLAAQLDGRDGTP